MTEPDGLEEAPFEYSNFDHAIPVEADELLRKGAHWMQHCAWGHWGAIWFAEGKFHERVMRYSSHVETMSASSLRDLINDVNAEYGSD